MSNGIAVSPSNSVNKTRNAILRMKNCSPKLRSKLRERCQQRIQNERFKILNTLRKISEQDTFKVAFGNIICEEWKNIDDDELCEPLVQTLDRQISEPEFNLDEELLLEELLEKELLLEHEEWLFQQYEELLSEQLETSNDVVCPLCCAGYLELKDISCPGKVQCTKCSEIITIDKSLLDLQSAIYECLSWHEKQCNRNPGFIKVFKNKNESNLCVICDHCSFLNVVG
ncbi:hypothetical protein RUM43_005356 [Polyplax serrata]|uniref:RPA-interacting protein C-terminal domain-containing protein n=1 Tax=Polyplax serrata TaxID=468196 RepID=A0AAN8PIX0_POLSC